MARATLETLPFELQIGILRQITDQDSLASAVFASPVLYQSYLSIRFGLLSSLVKRECETLMLDMKDAIIAVRSRGLPWLDHEDEAIAMLDIWRRSEEMTALNRSPDFRTDRPKDLEEASELLTFIRKLRFFVEDFAQYAPLPKKKRSRSNRKRSKHPVPLQLTPTEQRRLVRALCRLQIHANIIGPPAKTPENGYNISRTPKSQACFKYSLLLDDDQEAFRFFFEILPPWEIEEMCSAFQYLETVAQRASKDICKHMREAMNLAEAIYKDLPTFSPNSFEFWPKELQPPVLGICMCTSVFAAVASIPGHISSMANFGPEMIHRIISTKSGLLKQNLVMANAIIPSRDASDLIVRYPDMDSFWPLLHPASADRYQKCRLRDISGPGAFLDSERPNLAWLAYYIQGGNNPENQDEYLVDVIDWVRGQDASDELGGCYALWDDVRLTEWDIPKLRRR